MKKSAAKQPAISKASLLFLQRKFWLLYLYSPKARRDFRHLILRSHKTHRRKKFLRLFIKSIEEFDQKETAKLKNFYSHSKVAHVITGIFALSVLFIVLQLLYPSDRALPFARLQANGHVGFSREAEIQKQLQDFDQRIVYIHTHNKDLTTSYTDLGVRINIDETFDKLNQYSLKQRLIPFSIIFSGNRNFEISRSLDQKQLEIFVNDVVAERDKTPVDARIELNGRDVKLIPAEEGFKYEKSALESQILRSDLKSQSKIVFAPTVLYPKITTYVANDRAISLKKRLSADIVILADEKSLTISADTLASWLSLEPKPDKGDFEISFNEAKILSFLRPFVTEFDYPSEPSETTMLNGLPAGRLPGKNGRSININQLVEQIRLSSKNFTSTIYAPVQRIMPTEIISRRYTRDSQGLQNLLQYWVANNPGNYSIDIRDMNGRINAGINQNQHFSAAGIYQIFLASMVYSKISAGSLSGTSMTAASQNVNWCIDKMIYESHTGCTNALGDIVGWSNSDDFLNAQGFSSTTLSKGASLTTAADAAKWFEKLYGRSLTSDSQASTLLSVMSRQVNRSGIPAGLPGIRVDNKAGSSGRYHHDVGLVYHPKGKYIVAILSQNSSMARIADLSREIEKVFDQ